MAAERPLPVGDFGVPGTTRHDYTLCVYSGGNSAPIAIPAGASWQAAGTQGFHYKFPSGTPAGAQKALLKAGPLGKAKAQVKGQGVDLPDTLVPALTLPVPAQLVNDTNSVGWESVFTTSTKNDTKQLKAKTP